MSRDHFRLLAVEPRVPGRLRLHYADGAVFIVNLLPWIASRPYLASLADAALFGQARVGLAGSSVTWVDDELELAADNLRNLAVEQAGGIGHERLWNWMHHTGLTLEQAARALGISRRMLIYYRNGERPIPRAVWLACLGWDAVRPQGDALPERTPSAREYAALHA